MHHAMKKIWFPIYSNSVFLGFLYFFIIITVAKLYPEKYGLTVFNGKRVLFKIFGAH